MQRWARSSQLLPSFRSFLAPRVGSMACCKQVLFSLPDLLQSCCSHSSLLPQSLDCLHLKVLGMAGVSGEVAKEKAARSLRIQRWLKSRLLRMTNLATVFTLLLGIEIVQLRARQVATT